MTSVGLVQMACVEDVVANRDRAEAGIRDCAARGAGVVCLQELFTTLYFARELNERYFDWAEPIPGPTVERFGAIARELGVVLVLPFFERRAPGLYHNSAVVIDADGRALGTYRKMHIPHDPGFEEKYYFAPGDLGFRAFDTAAGRIAVLICWDQWFPEGARLAALAGAKLIFYPTAIGWKPSAPDEYAAYHDAWMTGMRAHAIHNGCYVAAVNRVGVESPRPGTAAPLPPSGRGDEGNPHPGFATPLPSDGRGGGGEGIRFWGRSFVADPLGRLVATAGEGEENLVVPIDFALVESTRRGWPFLRDRRVDAYGDLLKRFIDNEDK